MNGLSLGEIAETGGDAVCRALEQLGVRCVFGIPSQQNLALYEALFRRGTIRHVGARHEAGAVHAADGYARATGELGVAIVSTGPGTTNAMTGLYEAGFASSPVLLITTQIDRVHLGRGRGFIHDADGQLAMLHTITRRSECVMHASQIADTIISVAHDIQTGRPQPGAVEIPTDLLMGRASPPSPGQPGRPVRLKPDHAKLEQALQLLNSAKRPLIWVGGGCVTSDADVAVRSLAEKLSAPVVSSSNGRGVVPTDHALYITSQTNAPPFRSLLENADLVLAIGTRFQAFATANWTLPMPSRLIHIDADPTIFAKNFIPELPILGDAREAASWLAERVVQREADRNYLDIANRVRNEIAADTKRKIGADHARICDAIDRLAPASRNVVCDATMTGTTWGSQRLPVRQPRQFTYSTSLAIGPAFPLGIGAAIGSGRKTIILHGDGGVMLNLGELATAVEEKAPIILLVFNNRGYGVLKYIQGLYGIPAVAVDLHTPDFVQVGAAMGMASRRVDSVKGFEEAFAAAVAGEGPQLIEIDITHMAPLQP